MRTQPVSTITAIFLAAMLFISPAWGGSSGEQRVSYESYGSYETFVDQQIQHNEFKAALGSTNTPNLQKAAEVSREKADFLKENRDALVADMEADNVEKKPYKMTHYLNQTFYDSFREGAHAPGAVAAKSYEGYIDKQIRHNEFKASLGSPSFPNLQKIARAAREKADFLRENRDALLAGMKADNVVKKPYKMTLYLNHTFYDAIRDDGAVLLADAAGDYENPDEKE